MADLALEIKLLIIESLDLEDVTPEDIVDDEPLIRDTLGEYLAAEGAVVAQASNGNEAYALILENTYHVILSDVRMPECSGVELLKKIRESNVQMPPVVMMSAFTDISENKARELGAKGMFLKPDSYEYLKELLIDAID